MQNDFLSSGSSLRVGTQPGSGPKGPLFKETKVWLAAALCALSVASLGCGADDKGLTYGKDVRPIFSERCTLCHRPGGPSRVDIQSPFSSPEGLVIAKNRFKEAHPELNLPEYNVLAGDPDNSFLIYKIDDTNRLPPDPDKDGPLEPPAGMHMPLDLPPLLFEQVHVIEEWVKAGAPLPDVMFQDPGAPAAAAVPATDEQAAIPAHDEVKPQLRSFNKDIRPIIGSDDDLTATFQATLGVCTPTATKLCPRCIFCHYEDGPNLPDLTDVYDPVNGLVNATAHYRSDMKRVDPGHPENSLLIQKLHYENFTSGQARSDYGAQMPYTFTSLSRNQVETVRQWIQEGAKP